VSGRAVIPDPVEAVLAEARRYVGVAEQPPGSNRGVQIDYWLTEVGAAPGLPWCAAFISQVGRQALGVAWPVPRTASVQAIADWAVPRKLLLATPVPGDLFLTYFESLKRYAHVGLIVKANGQQVVCYEGNTNPGGSREGYGVFERQRTWGPAYRAVHWVAAL